MAISGLKLLLVLASAATIAGASATNTTTTPRNGLNGTFLPRRSSLRRDLHVISSDDVRRTVEEVQLKETLSIPNNIMTPDGTLFGGISGITYDEDRRVYYAVTNDIESSHEPDHETTAPTNTNPPTGTSTVLPTPVKLECCDIPDSHTSTQPPTSTSTNYYPYPPTSATHKPRFYTLTFDDYGNAQILDVIYLRDFNHKYYQAGEVIPQAIAYSQGQIYISLDAGPKSSWDWKPQIYEYNSTGFYQGNFSYPSYFRPEVGFTALTITPKEDKLYAATGRGLRDDRPNYIRLVEFDLETRTSGKQVVYEAEEMVVGMVSVDDNGGFAILERSNVIPQYDPNYTTLPPTDNNPHTTTQVSRSNDNQQVQWEGYDATLFFARILDAIDVQTINDLKDVHTLNTMKRKRMYEWLNVTKMEAMGNDQGYRIKKDEDEHGRRTKRTNNLYDDRRREVELDIILVSDNQFSPEVQTDVFIVELDATTTPILKPQQQTEDVLDDGTMTKAALDPAIWVDPKHPEDSIIIAALSMRDIGVYGLTGELKQRVGNDGDAMGVDVMYAFKLDDDNLIDIAIVSDGTNHRLRVYKIERDDHGQNFLTGITDGSMPTIETPKGIAVYHSPYTGRQYVFVESRDDFIIQTELEPTNDRQRVTGKIVREIYLPSKSGGIVVDNELGFLYVSLPDNYEQAIVKYDAEPNSYQDYINYPKTIAAGHEEYFAQGGIRDLALYYGDKGEGYLVVGVSGDSTFAVFERGNENGFFGSFTIGRNKAKGVDKTDNTQGIAITNLELGSEFECGLFVAQDFDNEEAKVDGLPVGELVNSNTNFKLVPFEELAENLYYYLDIDTDSWDPRRFSLVIWVNSIGQDIYSALNIGDVSGRDAEKLLSYLNEATQKLYPRSAKKQQMISLIDPFDQRRRLGSSQEERREETRRRLQEDLNRSEEERRDLKQKECRRKKRRKLLEAKPSDVRQALRDFTDHLDRLQSAGRINETNYKLWRYLAEEVEHAIPYPN